MPQLETQEERDVFAKMAYICELGLPAKCQFLLWLLVQLPGDRPDKSLHWLTSRFGYSERTTRKWLEELKARGHVVELEGPRFKTIYPSQEELVAAYWRFEQRGRP